MVQLQQKIKASNSLSNVDSLESEPIERSVITTFGHDISLSSLQQSLPLSFSQAIRQRSKLDIMLAAGFVEQ
jgi:hypothetical protein